MLALGLPEPDLQVTIGEAGGPTYRVDLLVREFSTVIEVDGKIKYVGSSAAPDQAWQDKRRRDRLFGRGYEVERFVAADAYHRENWGRRVVHAFERACMRHGRPAPDLTLPWYP
jgi:very-short-patch-repair endonuclease